MATSPAQSRTRSSPLDEQLLVDEILTRLPVAAAVRFRAVCRSWNSALTSDHFVDAHAARAAAARHPQIVFFPPTERGVATSFYACSLPVDGGTPAVSSREMLSVGKLAGEYLMLSGNKPCQGLTLLFDVRLGEYHLFNLSTGQHVSLPPCETAEEITPVEVPTKVLLNLKQFPLELSSTGLGFDRAAGQHKVVRLFRNIFGQQKCEVCSLTPSGEWTWRRCAGGNAPPGFARCLNGEPPVALHGSLYWLLHRRSSGSAVGDPQQDAPILSLSVGAERFGWVSAPPRLASRIRHLTDLDGSLCAVVHDSLVDDVLLLLTWTPSSSPSWSLRCRVDVGGLPRPIRDELSGEREIIPLCSVGRKKILLATSRHKVYAYDTERGAAEEVFDMNRFVDVPPHNSESRLFINIGLHEERIAGVGRTLAGDNRMQVKRRGGTVVGRRREASSSVCQEYREQDEEFHRTREVMMQLAFPTYY